MRRIILCLVALFMLYVPTNEAKAQDKGDFRFGTRAAFYTRAKAFGVGVYGTYCITDWLNIEPGVHAICKKRSSVDIYCDFQVPLEIATYWHVFPIVGVSVNEIGSKSANAYGWSCGLNLGLGTSYQFSSHWNAHAQVKWMGQSAKNHKSPVIVAAGIGYNF
ncbi:MAG: hypothetical protein IJD53_03630 [Alistipes sp.]|nr:hypothetical protein [Alistipes sp.]